MSFFTKGDFKTREQWLRKEKRTNLKKQEEKFNQSKHIKQQIALEKLQVNKKTLNDILTLDTDKSIISQQQVQMRNPQFKSQLDTSIYKSMEGRLNEKQEISRQQKKQIAEISNQIQFFKTDNAILRGINSEIPNYEERMKVLQENERMKCKAQQIEAYLNMHGAFWEGSTLTGDLDITNIKKHITQAKTNYRTPTEFQLQTLIKRIAQLNESLLEELGSKKIVNSNGVARFIQSEKTTIQFYKNAIHFNNIGYFMYNHKEGVKILADISDGYYPHILKSKYPNGVFIEIQNRLSQEWKQANITHEQKNDWFFGQGISFE